MSLPLQDVRVVEAAEMLAGPGAAMFLADQGADVIKLETLAGDIIRGMSTSSKLATHSKGSLTLNRNKRSISADLTTAEGRGVLHRLAGWADVFITSLRPEVAKRLEADYDTLSGINSKLVYAVMTGYGPRGPEAGKPGYDLVLQARAGIVAERRAPDGSPITPYLMVSDISGAMFLPYAIMCALWERQRTGQGRRVDISLLGMSLGMQVHALCRLGPEDSPLPGMNPSALSTAYACADGRWLMLVAPADHQWRAVCRALDLEHLAEDPMFVAYDGRSKHTPELHEILSALFATRPLKEWQALLEHAGVSCGPVMTRNDVFDDPQILANEMMISTEHPAVGRVDMVGFPFTLSGQDTAERVRRPAPALGEQSREVLAELGYSTTEVDALLRSGAVREPSLS